MPLVKPHLDWRGVGGNILIGALPSLVTNSCNVYSSKQARLYWSKTEGCNLLKFDGVPFSIDDVRTLDCQFGEKYYKQKKPLGKRLWLQGTRKLGCAAHVQIKSFPECAVIPSEHISKWKLQCLRQ